MLQRQVDAFGDSVDALADPQQRADCRAVETAVDVGLALLEAVRRFDRRLDEALAAGKTRLDKREVEQMYRVYEAWYTAAGRLLPLVERREAEGCAVDNAAEFKQACRSSHIPGIDPKRLQSAADEFAKGRGRPLKEVVDALLRR